MYSLEPVDTIHHCNAKLAFILDFYSQPKQPKPEISEEGSYGLVLILIDIIGGLTDASDKVTEAFKSIDGGGK